MSERIRLMTHNVWRCDVNKPAWEEKGEDCSAAVRVKGHVRVYQETQPDIIGCQEMSALMMDLLKEQCSEIGLDYTLIWGRCTPIFYRADKFELVDSAFGTYPEYIDGYEGSFNDGKEKSWNLGVFREKKSGKCFVFGTTHLWWKTSDKNKMFSAGSAYQAYSDEAREYQIAILAENMMKYAEKYDCPLVLVGDFNTDYESKAVKYLFGKGFRHAHDIAVEYAEEAIGYHNCFPSGYETFYSDKPFECSIDHIVLLGEPEGSVKRFERYSPDYYFPISDHSPAYIDIEL